MFSKTLATAALLAGFAVSAVSSIPTISVVGSKFFTSNGTQFFVKGVAYQLTEADPLIDTAQCTRDAGLMKTLGANTIRVYHVDPNGDHSGCMAAFAGAGIYLIVDLDTFNTYIDPRVTYWNQTQVNAYAKVLDAFAPYDNTLGYFIGNEVIALANQSLAAPYIKAATRDLKAYRDSKKYREIPIGYSAADIAELRPMLQNYLACGGNASESIDMFGLNAYEWCGNNDFQTSGYSTLNTYAENYNIPIFFSETGCNTAPPRTFDDQAAIFGPDMNSLWSGAIIYEWIEEVNDYGLISYGQALANTVQDAASGIQDGILRSGKPTPVAPDFTNLQSQWATLTPTGIASSAYSPSLTPPACPSSTASGWLVDGNVKLPSIGQVLQVSTAGSPTATGSATGSAPSPSSTKGAASGGKEITGMSVALVAVMLGFMYWL